MEPFTKEELAQALRAIESTIHKCEKAQPKRRPGTAQHTLLVRRIKALRIASALIKRELGEAEWNITIQRAGPADAKRLAEVFNRSFYDDFQRYGECPGYNKTEVDMLSAMQQYQLFQIVADNRTVGAVSVHEPETGNFFLGALCVVPEYTNCGIGSRVMALLDQTFPHAKHWSLETPSDKLQNHHFYQKFGYVVTKEYTDGNVRISYFERQLAD